MKSNFVSSFFSTIILVGLLLCSATANQSINHSNIQHQKTGDYVKVENQRRLKKSQDFMVRNSDSNGGHMLSLPPSEGSF
jgi:hypothetical protein